MSGHGGLGAVGDLVDKVLGRPVRRLAEFAFAEVVPGVEDEERDLPCAARADIHAGGVLGGLEGGDVHGTGLALGLVSGGGVPVVEVVEQDSWAHGAFAAVVESDAYAVGFDGQDGGALVADEPLGRVLVAARCRDLCAELGAIVVDPREDGATDDALRPFGGAVSHAFDAVGMSATLATALAATSLGGIVCLVGMAQPRVELDAYAVSTAERTIVGSFTYGSGDFRAAATLLASDPDLALRLISERVPLSQGPEAFAAQGRGEVAPGKVVVDFTS